MNSSVDGSVRNMLLCIEHQLKC